jgi:hypothetical protein
MPSAKAVLNVILEGLVFFAYAATVTIAILVSGGALVACHRHVFGLGYSLYLSSEACLPFCIFFVARAYWLGYAARRANSTK